MTPPRPKTVTTTMRGSIARVYVARDGDEIARGTAFLVLPSVVLTAYHVVADRMAEGLELHGEITLEFPDCQLPATVDPNLCDKAEDWAILRCPTPEGLEPLSVALIDERGSEWQSYGFPDANPRDGMAFGGTVEDHRARLEGVEVLQLFSRQAAAGRGAPVRGLSGAPVIVGSTVVGHMRFALMKDGETVAGTLYACPISSVAQRIPELLSESSRLRVPGLRVRQKLGEGGMGEVWLAQQREPVRRQVAVKVIKWGLDSKEVLGRFESERQALALMSHEGIARMLDAGTTDQGRPYFVMEYVPGVPITDYCDRNKLGTQERLQLFEQLCRAIHHAHQRGIIHRDIKPSNVLVELVEGEPRCKVIDFGVAKATHQRLTEKTVFTRHGLMLGTPSYMSPEQADLDQLDIDTTSDVYSLGALLYELLTGLLPFDAQRLREVGYSEMQRILREEEPPHPSTRVLSASADSEVLRARSMPDAATLVRTLRGDLDWITLKALEKDRTRRYSSAAELGADVRRHLEHHPVLASPPSRLYRTRRFIRRHRAGAVAVAVIVVAMLGGTSLALWQAARARVAEAQARDEASTARQVTDFLIDLFEVSNPSEALGNTITAREVLETGAEKVRGELEGQPVVRARLLETIGVVFRNLGLYEQAGPLLEESLATRERHLGRDHPQTAQSLFHLAWQRNLKGDYEGALELGERALAIREKALGPHHLDTASSLNDIAVSLQRQGDYEGAIRYFTRALEIREAVDGPQHHSTAAMLDNLGNLMRELGRSDEARSYLERALAIREVQVGSDHPDTAQSLDNLGAMLFKHGDYPDARLYFERALEIRRATLGPDHPHTGISFNNVGVALREEGRLEEARSSFERDLAIAEKAFGPEHPDLAITLKNIGDTWVRMGEYAAARPFFDRGLAITEKMLGPEHPTRADLLSEVGNLYRLTGELEEARLHLAQALSIREKAFGRDHPETGAVLHRLGKLAQDQHDYAGAERYYDSALAVYEQAGLSSTQVGLVQLRADRARLLALTGRGGGDDAVPPPD